MGGFNSLIMKFIFTEFCALSGVGPLVWIITPELYPTWARGFGTSSATAVGWVTNLLVSLTFLSLTQAITRYGEYAFTMNVGG